MTTAAAFPMPEDFRPDFNKGNGLVAAIAQDAGSGEVLMLAWMNQEAWEATLCTGEAHYFSRSRNSLWHKGERSGNVQRVQAIRLDCDSDALIMDVEQLGGAACHTGRRSCFYRKLTPGGVELCSPQIFDPTQVYTQG